MEKDDRLKNNALSIIQTVVPELHSNFYRVLNESFKSRLAPFDSKCTDYIFLNIENKQIVSILNMELSTIRMT